MENIFDKNKNYINILNRIQKKISSYEGILIIKKQYFTDNGFYYFLCLLFRFIHLISFSGDYFNMFINNRFSFPSFKRYLKKLTLYNIIEQFNISFNIYAYMAIIILILFIFRVLSFIHIQKGINSQKSKLRKNYILPNKYIIIIDHIVFLLFPYIIEYLSFIYYIFFFPKKFVIKLTKLNMNVIIIIMIINTFLIIAYNLDNYINMICSNRLFTITIFDAYLNEKEKNLNKYKKPVVYKCSNITIYIYIFLQNLLIFFIIENYINSSNKIIFKIISSIIIVFIILVLFLTEINNFNYLNFYNYSINLILLFCFYSIIFDLLIFLNRYRNTNLLNDTIYILVKIFFSYITYVLIILKTHSFLQKKIIEIVFQENNKIKENHFINSFYYLQSIMLKIKEQNDIESAFLLTKFLNGHINKCNKLVCNCALFKTFIKKEDYKKISNEEEIKNYISELLIIINYLFESAFINYDYYKSYDLVILLSEHFCHLKKNPIMAFSLIRTFFLKQKNSFNRFELILLYELSQKYIYYISAKILYDLEEGIINNNIQLLNKERIEYFQIYYYNLKMSCDAKKLICNYIDNEIKILKYKYIFEDSLSYQFDENNENIISVKINFFNEKSKIDNFYYDNIKINKIGQKDETNLYKVIYLLKNEQIYYLKLINSIKEMEIIKGIPVFMIFKYFLFFDIFDGGKIENEIGNKLYNSLTSNMNLYNGIIKKSDYRILKKRYIEQNNKINSKSYSMFEFKKEIRTKYFSENSAIKLGFKQKDIINQKIDILMPRVFFKSHQNAIKQLILGNQLKYYKSNQCYFFDKTTTILYSSSFEVSMIYSLSKNLIALIEIIFNFENNYTFMLDNNFELLATSKNFEDEYYLNQRLLHVYDIRIMDILCIKPEKLYNSFKKEFNEIQLQKFMRQIKTEEYFIPHFYASEGDKTVGIMNQAHFNNSKSKILSIISKSKNTEEDFEKMINNMEENDEEEENKHLKKDNLKNSLSEIIEKKTEVIFHKNYKRVINKGNFIENIAKELTKIPDNDLMLENDKISHNLIISAKKLISKLLTKSELANDFIKIGINLSFFYDRSYYFIIIDDEKKSYLNITKNIHFQINEKDNQLITSRTTSTINTKNTIPYNKNDKKSKNKVSILNKNSFKLIGKKGTKNNLIEDKDQNKFNNENNDKYAILERIKENRDKINKDKFISIIRWILSISIVLILILYIIIIFFQKHIIYISKEILFTYYHTSHTRDITLFIHSKLLQIFYIYKGFINHIIINEQEHQETLIYLNTLLKDNYYSFIEYYYKYNIAIGHNLSSLFLKRNFTKLRGFWQEINYECNFPNEFEFIIYNIYSINISNKNAEEMKIDLDNFIFFKDRTENRERIHTSYIRLLYYLCANYEFAYKNIFQEIEDGIFDSYNVYINKQMTNYILYEILGLIFYTIFYIVVNFYLYNSNEIIIKNIIFLFLDFTEEEKNITKNRNQNIINIKLLEFKKLIDDFDLNEFQNYSKNLDNINKNKSLISSNMHLNNIINNNNDSHDNETRRSFTSNKSNKINQKQNSLRKKEIKENIVNQIIDINKNLHTRNKVQGMNNSSHNYLVESNSKFFKDKLNNNSINASNSFLTNSQSSNQNNISKQNINNNTLKKASDEQENIKDLLFNKSRKNIVLLIKIYMLMILILFLLIIFLSVYKIVYSFKRINTLDHFFSDFYVITNRYSILYYFHNTLRTLLIFPNDNRKKVFESNLEAIEIFYEQQNKLFYEILSNNFNTYEQVIKLFNILMLSKNNITEILKDKICSDQLSCSNYLSTNQSIFGSGVDFAYRSCINDLKNIYFDYKQLKNKNDIKIINSTLINNEDSRFSLIGSALSNMFLYVKEKIYTNFEIDVDNFNESYNKIMNLLNIISIIITILAFLAVIIVMFISIWRYTEPIKRACYRINCSFYFIKKYSLTNFRKSESYGNKL